MDWRRELRNNVTTAEEVFQYLNIEVSKKDLHKYNEIIDKFPMSVSQYYLSLINPEDEDDVIRRMCVPSINETDISGSFDTSGEKDNTVMTGLQHKYRQTALVLSTNRCAMYCRHCFRKRLVGVNGDEITKEFDNIINYIREHKEINNVLISGGDAFLNNNKKIEEYLEALCDIDHLDIIRFGTRTPVVLPSRIYDDMELLDILDKYRRKKTIYVVTHFNHSREITKESKRAIRCLLDRGIIIKNQTVLLKGINDDGETLAKLTNNLTRIGVVPYYVFQCRPVKGVKNQFQVPLLKAERIIKEARKKLNGQGKCFRFIMSTERGKIEVMGLLKENKMLFKFHQAKSPEDENRIFVKDIKEDQCWIDVFDS